MKGFNIYWGSGASMLFFVGIGYISARVLNFSGSQFYMFMALMSALGFSSSAFFYFFQRKATEKIQGRMQAAAAGAGAGGGTATAAGSGTAAVPEVDHLIKEADTRLSQSKGQQGATIGNLPLIFIIGDQGTTKTSVVVHSGLEPELLAGQVYAGTEIASTTSGNVWFARDAVFVEAGGKLLAKPDSWLRLIKKLQPGKLKSVMGKGQQAPRGVLLCFDCEAFTKQGAAEQLAATSRYLQARLGEISQHLGISFPVYVLFTRTDRLGFFQEFVRNLSNEEATQVFGATLPLRQTHGGVYAEEEGRRLTGAFDELFHSLCDRRIDYLPREQDPEKLPGTYEFPREFRKLRSSLVQFLVDVCRPSQLRASPFLRGFYFSGVRPIVINEVNPAPIKVAPTQQKFEAGATRMFRAGMELPQSVGMPQQAGVRRVPQWMFLSHLFADVLLQDRVALGASGSSIKVSGMRRLLLGLASLAFLFFCLMFLLSWLNNRSVEKEAIAAGQGLSGERVSGQNLPTMGSLQKLERLRASLAQLTDWHKNGHPIMYGWMLYSGESMLPEVRHAYYGAFRDTLFGQVQGDWVSYLSAVKIPPGPTDDYGYGYNALKGYLLTTSEWKRIPTYQDFLAEALYSRWTEGREGQIDKPMSDLARAQFDFYAKDLVNGNPYTEPVKGDTVEHARDYLSRFNATDRVYQALLAEAARKGNIIIFNRDYPGSERVIRNVYPVPAGFTKNAFPYMKQLVGEAEKRFGGEKWVLGEGRGPTITDWTATKKQLWDKYVADYIKEWRTFINESKWVGYGGYNDEANKLTIVSANDSPLLRLFAVISTNTNVDPDVKAKFDGASKVVPPDSPALITPGNQAYMTGLNQLQLSIKAAADNLNAGTADASKQAATSAKSAAYGVTSTFVPDLEAHVDKKMTELLEDPIRPAEVDVRGPLNAAGRAFCQASAFGKFPFVPTSPVDASIGEVNAIFRPKEGSLWQFYENTLKQNLTCSASGCQPTGVAPPLSPSFVAFFSEAVRFSRALYGENGTDPKLTYTMTPRSDQADAFTFTVDGAKSTLKNGQSGNYNWSSSTNTFAIALRLTGGAGEFPTPPYTGVWAPFHFFADADNNIPSGAATIFVMKPRQGKSGKIILEYQVLVDTHGAPAVFSKNFWAQLRCIPGVAK